MRFDVVSGSGVSAVGRVLAIRDTYGALSEAARSMARADMGAAFSVSHSEETVAIAAAGAATSSPPLQSGHNGARGEVQRHVTRVSRCFYLDFFARHGASQVLASRISFFSLQCAIFCPPIGPMLF